MTFILIVSLAITLIFLYKLLKNTFIELINYKIRKKISKIRKIKYLFIKAEKRLDFFKDRLRVFRIFYNLKIKYYFKYNMFLLEKKLSILNNVKNEKLFLTEYEINREIKILVQRYLFDYLKKEVGKTIVKSSNVRKLKDYTTYYLNTILNVDQR